MKMKIMLVTAACLFGFATASQAEETMGEKAKAEAKDAKRALKKGVNRTKEAVCGKLTGDSKVECLAKKGKHRMEEGAEGIQDKASEVKESMDTNEE